MEKQTRFIIISTVYNKEPWIEFNVGSIKQQTYKNYLTIYGYDKSADNTKDQLVKSIGSHENFIVYDVPNKHSQINNFCSCLSYLEKNNLINDEDVIVEIDADDWLINPFIFNYLNEVYKNPNIWMTYGQYIEYPSGLTGGHYYMELNDFVDANNAYRQHAFPYSHLKTYKKWLFDKVPHEYLIDPRTNEYWKTTADFAMCLPMVEMAGKQRIHRIDEPVYVYNSGTNSNESSTMLKQQKEAEQLIRQFTPLTRL